MPVKSQQHPIFERYSLPVLSRRLGISEAYLSAMKAGYKRLGPRFKSRAADILGKPQSELFLPPAPAGSGAVGADSNGGPQEEERGQP